MYDFEFLTAEISEALPCGPDLAEDLEFGQYLALSEGQLPASYFRFDRTEIDFEKELAAMRPFLDQTHDLRLLVVLAKYTILDRRIDAFVNAIRAIAALLSDHWQAVHPGGEDGDFSLRINTLEALDDMAQVVLPLQHMPIISSRRYGGQPFRTYLIGKGKVTARDDEQAIDSGSFDAAVGDCDIDHLGKMNGLFADLRQALLHIENTVRENLDFQGSVRFERLKPLVEDIATFLREALVRRDPGSAAIASRPGEQVSAGPDTTSVTPIAAAGAFTAPSHATEALAALAGYYARREPSSPALLLIRQAQKLMGKNFFDAIQLLIPNNVGTANLRVGGAALGFGLKIEQLGAVADEFSGSIDDDPEDEERVPEDEEVAGRNEATDDSTEDGTDAVEEDAPAPEPLPAPRQTAAYRPAPVRSRPDALALIDALQRYFSVHEPTSPIPLLLEKARSVGTLDFMGLLGLVLPASRLRQEDD